MQRNKVNTNLLEALILLVLIENFENMKLEWSVKFIWSKVNPNNNNNNNNDSMHCHIKN